MGLNGPTHMYPVMQLPAKKEKQIENQVVNSKEVDVEVEVEIVQPLKRLFLFASKEAHIGHH